MASVRLSHISKQFGSTKALKNISLDIPDKSFLVLLGPSGCGKTTLLRIIAGLERPTEGKVLFDNEDVTERQPKDRDIAMVFQSYALYPHMTVYENMAFGLKMRKMEKKERDRLVLEAAELLGIRDLLHRKPGMLSGGQRQRVALGRAIVRKPKVFLLDEPLSNLDAKLRSRMRTELVKLHQKLSVTTIYVTHDQMEAMTMASIIALLKDGELQQVGEPLALYHHPANTFVASFLGSPPMNLYRGALKKEGDRAKLVMGSSVIELSGAVPVFEGEVILGFRPESVTLKSQGAGAQLEGVVELVEKLGSENILVLDLGGRSLQVKKPPHFCPARGERLTLFVPASELRWFDARSRKLLS